MPRFAAGNDDVDVELPASAQSALLGVHDDVREYVYTDGAERVRATARRVGRTTVSVQDGWNAVLKERPTQEEPSAPHQ
ncbi:hypothetical protein [Streptomyces ardesiacus]|uniref:Uncharacterized protein n=1 Tax=Streptomyces ardesiacus TaxID=285564 RepID=A0ABW8H2D3_9ACTN